MNGRLAALAEQAGYFIKFERTGNDVTVVYTKEPGTDGDLALFAELIVEECIKLNGKELAMAGHSRMVDVYCEHFGIEY